ncbi:MAG: aminotransferase class V-fold PLP-dependent enzyme [Intestinimonas sp.]|nr:aminotransferase class V-fold PLP-dependent enzyme [Intestinimonas sp.]
MRNTPLYSSLRAFADTQPLRMHMPGHHGKPLHMPELERFSELDFTELPPTGNLFSPGGAIEAAEDLWARAFGMSACLFLTGGSTQGIHAALTLACRPGDRLLMDRGCHRSVYHAMALLDLKPIYLSRPWRREDGVSGPISPQSVEKLLKSHPKCKTVCITSPTYYGVLSDIPAISHIVHQYGGILVVDGAHGAHLPFLGLDAFRGADLTVVSAHKTLPVPGQTALLFSGGLFHGDDLRRAGAIYGSSSPSYPMMAAMDVARAWLEEKGADDYRTTAAFVSDLRRTFSALRETPELRLDPARFVLNTPDGYVRKAALETLGVYPEMADCGHIVCILTCADRRAEFARLIEALNRTAPPAGTAARQIPPPPELPERVLSPRQAMFAPVDVLSLQKAEGQISVDQVAPYPPGVPIIAPGERIGKKHLSYLSEIGYNMTEKVRTLSHRV